MQEPNAISTDVQCLFLTFKSEFPCEPVFGVVTNGDYMRKEGSWMKCGVSGENGFTIKQQMNFTEWSREILKLDQCID